MRRDFKKNPIFVGVCQRKGCYSSLYFPGNVRIVFRPGQPNLRICRKCVRPGEAIGPPAMVPVISHGEPVPSRKRLPKVYSLKAAREKRIAHNTSQRVKRTQQFLERLMRGDIPRGWNHRALRLLLANHDLALRVADIEKAPFSEEERLEQLERLKRKLYDEQRNRRYG